MEIIRSIPIYFPLRTSNRVQNTVERLCLQTGSLLLRELRTHHKRTEGWIGPPLQPSAEVSVLDGGPWTFELRHVLPCGPACAVVVHACVPPPNLSSYRRNSYYCWVALANCSRLKRFQSLLLSCYIPLGTHTVHPYTTTNLYPFSFHDTSDTLVTQLKSSAFVLSDPC